MTEKVIENIWYISFISALLASVASVIFTQCVRDLAEEKRIYREKLEKGYEITEELQNEWHRTRLTINYIIQNAKDLSEPIPVSHQELRLKFDSRLVPVIKLELRFLKEDLETLKTNINDYNHPYFHLLSKKASIEDLIHIKEINSSNKVLNTLQNMSKKIEKEMDKPTNRINTGVRILSIIWSKMLENTQQDKQDV